jgi:hypothetical protein
MEAFEKAEGLSCLSATDGCNTYFMSEDGKVGGGTLMYCENAPVVWSCATQKDDGMTYITPESIDCWNATDENGKEILDQATGETILICPEMTMLQDGMWDNVCLEWAEYTWAESKNMCLKPGQEKLLSDNDWSFYNSIQTQLNDSQKGKVTTIMSKFHTLLEKFSEKKAKRLQDRFAKIIEMKISDILLKYPQDIAIPAKTDALYKTLSFLKFQVILWK